MGINCFDFERVIKSFRDDVRETLAVVLKGDNESSKDFYLGKESVLCDLLEYFGIEED